MADEAALALQPGGSPSAVSAEKESASPPTWEPLRKRPRRDGPGLGRSPGEPDGTAPEREAPAAAGGGPAAAAALWREVAAAGGEREAQVTAGGEGDNGPGLQVLSREPLPADDLDDDDDEGEEEEEAAAIGYRGAQRRGRPGLRTPPPLSWALLVYDGGASGGLGSRGWFCGVPLAPTDLGCAPPGLPAWTRERPADSFPPSPPSLRPRPAWAASRFAQPPGREAFAVDFKISFFFLLLFLHNAFVKYLFHSSPPPPSTFKSATFASLAPIFCSCLCKSTPVQCNA